MNMKARSHMYDTLFIGGNCYPWNIGAAAQLTGGVSALAPPFFLGGDFMASRATSGNMFSARVGSIFEMNDSRVKLTEIDRWIGEFQKEAEKEYKRIDDIEKSIQAEVERFNKLEEKEQKELEKESERVAKEEARMNALEQKASKFDELNETVKGLQFELESVYEKLAALEERLNFSNQSSDSGIRL